MSISFEKFVAVFFVFFCSHFAIRHHVVFRLVRLFFDSCARRRRTMDVHGSDGVIFAVLIYYRASGQSGDGRRDKNMNRERKREREREKKSKRANVRIS